MEALIEPEVNGRAALASKRVGGARCKLTPLAGDGVSPHVSAQIREIWGECPVIRAVGVSVLSSDDPAVFGEP